MNKEIKITIEISAGSNIKYEYNRKTGKIEVDRILRENFYYPANYGFVSEALDWDGDELDVLVYSPEVFTPGVQMNVRIVGAMRMIDDGETDTKLVAVHADDYRLVDVKTMEDIDVKWKQSVETFFTTYKNWKRPGITSVPGFEDTNWAIREYEECVELMDKYGHLEKKDFIFKMQQQHPDKYITHEVVEGTEIE